MVDTNKYNASQFLYYILYPQDKYKRAAHNMTLKGFYKGKMTFEDSCTSSG